MIENDELFEYAIVYNDYKGNSKKQVRDALASGQDVIMRLDVQALPRFVNWRRRRCCIPDHPKRTGIGGAA